MKPRERGIGKGSWKKCVQMRAVVRAMEGEDGMGALSDQGISLNYSDQPAAFSV